MTITTAVYDSDQHKVFLAYVGIGESGLKNLCAYAPEDFLLRNVHPYGDTMFNGRQLRRMLDEITLMLDSGQREENEIVMLTRLHKVAAEAIRLDGYLWFLGD